MTVTDWLYDIKSGLGWSAAAASVPPLIESKYFRRYVWEN
jgi:hypothetical protein